MTRLSISKKNSAMFYVGEQDPPSPFEIPGDTCKIGVESPSPLSPADSSPSASLEESWEVLHRRRNRSLNADMIPCFNNLSLTEIESGRSEASVGGKSSPQLLLPTR